MLPLKISPLSQSFIPRWSVRQLLQLTRTIQTECVLALSGPGLVAQHVVVPSILQLLVMCLAAVR